MTREGGQALIETILLGLVLLAPLVWGLSVLSEMHRAALASSSALREAGTDAARSATGAEARRAVTLAVSSALADEGLEPARARVEIRAPAGLRRGAVLRIEVAYPVPVFDAPFLGSVSTPVVWAKAAHVARIDPYRSR